QPSRAILVGFGEMREEQASRAFESLGGTISREALVAGLQVLEGGSADVDLRFEPVVDVASLPMRALMQTFLTLHGRLGSSLSQDDILFPLLEEILVYQLLSSWPRRGALASGRVQAGTSRHVRTAMDYIDAHIAERLTLAEVAKAARISVRALQVAFRNELGTTPFGYIIDLRLDRVYADLASHGGSQSIKVVAGRWGFVHMSDFTKRFRQRFGHVP
ncbi:helix-turn-helix transcriptional regulator, partial [Aureimonas pseudogalii]|uniref:helix-turn-helix transcriptional regulator n=1 Tax=Aureimonas pseudogalii TaxID=1744844 RepID=UPI0035EB64D0